LLKRSSTSELSDVAYRRRRDIFDILKKKKYLRHIKEEEISSTYERRRNTFDILKKKKYLRYIKEEEISSIYERRRNIFDTLKKKKSLADESCPCICYRATVIVSSPSRFWNSNLSSCYGSPDTTGETAIRRGTLMNERLYTRCMTVPATSGESLAPVCAQPRDYSVTGRSSLTFESV